MSQVVPSVNVLTAISTPVAASNTIPFGTTFCAIDNRTSATLIVTSAQGTALLQPDQSNLYPCNKLFPVPSVQPLNSTGNPSPGTLGTFVGVVQATFYQDNDPQPVGYPVSLQPFASGQELFMAGNMAFSVPATGGLVVAGVDISPPIGTNQLLFKGLAYNLTGVSGNLQLAGDQTGKVYFQITGPLSQAATDTTISFAGSQDISYSFSLFDTGGGLGTDTVSWTNIFASSLPVPTQALASKGGAFNTLPQTILAAPAIGANYLFGLDIALASTSAVQVTLNDSAGGIVSSDVIPITAAAGYVQMPEMVLNGYRCAGILTMQATAGTLAGPGSVFYALRYAPGP